MRNFAWSQVECFPLFPFEMIHNQNSTNQWKHLFSCLQMRKDHFLNQEMLRMQLHEGYEIGRLSNLILVVYNWKSLHQTFLCWEFYPIFLVVYSTLNEISYEVRVTKLELTNWPSSVIGNAHFGSRHEVWPKFINVGWFRIASSNSRNCHCILSVLILFFHSLNLVVGDQWSLLILNLFFFFFSGLAVLIAIRRCDVIKMKVGKKKRRCCLMV